MKKKAHIDDSVVRIIEDCPNKTQSDCILGDGYSMDFTYGFHVELEGQRELTIRSWMFDELRVVMRKWLGDVCQKDGFTTVEIEEIKFDDGGVG